MNSTAQISILMPAYNTVQYIGEAIASVRAQSHTNWELIIVDDGSTDETADVVERLQQQDARIRLYRNGTNRGLGFTRNFALQQSQGDWVAMLDSDDIAAPTWLEHRLNRLRDQPALIAVTGSRVKIDTRGKRIKAMHESFSPLTVKWKLIFGNPVVNPGLVFRKIPGVGFRSLHYFEDWDLVTRLAEHGEIEVVNDHQVLYRVHPASASHQQAVSNEAKSIVHGIISRQCLRYFNEAPDPVVSWYFYRDRRSFPGDVATLEESVKTLNRFYLLFLERYVPTCELQTRELKMAYWDEFLHLARSGSVSKKHFSFAARHCDLSLSELMADDYSRRIAKRRLFLTACNIFR